MPRYQAPDSYTPEDGPHSDDEARREDREETALERYESDPDGQEERWDGGVW